MRRKTLAIASPPTQTISTINIIRKTQKVYNETFSFHLVSSIVESPAVIPVVKPTSYINDYSLNVVNSSVEQPAVLPAIVPLVEITSSSYRGISEPVKEQAQPFNTCSVLPIQTYVNSDTPYYVTLAEYNQTKTTGNFSTLNVSQYIVSEGPITATNTAAAALYITQGSGNASEIAFQGSTMNTLGTISFRPTGSVYDMIFSNAQIGGQMLIQNFGEISASQSDLFISSVTVRGIDVDGQILTANAEELLLNGIPIATTSNISSLADWSLYPMIQTLDGQNNSISSINTIDALTGNFTTLNSMMGNYSSITANSVTSMMGNYSSITANSFTVNTLIAQSTITNYSTITTVDIQSDIVNSSTITTVNLLTDVLNASTITAKDVNADNGFINAITGFTVDVDSVKANTASIPLISTGTVNATSLISQGLFVSTLTFASSIGATPSGQLSINNVGDLTFNGSTITAGSGGDASAWSQYPATQAVTMNGQALNSAGAIGATSIGSSGDINASGTIRAPFISASSALNGPSLNVANNDGIGGNVSADTVTSRNLLNAQNGVNGVGHISLIGNIGDSVILSTDANTTGIRLQAGAMLLTTVAAFSLNAGGAGNLAAGGALNLAAGDYIELNTGNVRCIGGSEIRVNTINGYSSQCQINAGNGSFTGTIAVPTLNTNTINSYNSGGTVITGDITAYGNITAQKNLSVSTITNLSTINGVDVAQYVNQTVSTFNTASISSLSVSSIVANYVGVNALETASIDKVSTLIASSITTNYIATAAIESASIDKVSTLTASSITSYFGSISTLNISTLNTIPAYKILPNQPIYQIYVAKNGSDTLGTGSIMQPFLTIAKALTTASAFSDTNIVTILLTPGNYTEAVSVTRNNTFINGLSVNSQEVSITGAVSFTTTTQTIGYIVGGVVGLTITGSLTFSSTALVPILYTALSGVINGISGTIPLTLSQASTTNSFSFSTQGMVITPVDTIGISINNVRASLIQTLVTGTTTLVQTTGNGSFSIFGSTLTNTNSTATAPPIVKLGNTVAVASGAMAINNSYLTYSSATVDTGLNKCCVQLSTTTTAAMNVSYNFLYCEGARVTNGSAGQYLCVQNPGTGVITFNYGGNYSGAGANHFPNASAKFVKTGYIATT
jgi:hypothetical protein